MHEPMNPMKCARAFAAAVTLLVAASAQAQLPQATKPTSAPLSNGQLQDNMAERTRACTACHGEQGRAGPDGYYPRLAGKPAGYLHNQLRNFSQGRRHYHRSSNLDRRQHQS